jgi:hypothetical protein
MCYSTLGTQGLKQIYPGPSLYWEVGALADIHLGGPGDRSRGLAGKAIMLNVLAGHEKPGPFDTAGRAKLFWVTSCLPHAACQPVSPFGA